MPTPKRILLCGIGPIPYGEPDRLFAPGLRLWGFAQALLQHGEQADILEIEFGEAASGRSAHLHELVLGDCAHGESKVAARSKDLAAAEPRELVAGVLSAKKYDAIVSTTDVMNKACAEAAGDIPLWCDFFGHPMAERQSQAFVYGSDGGIASQWDYVLPALLRGDRFSGCSEMQRLAIVGELGACGRLNRQTDGYPIVSSLPQIPVFKEFKTLEQEPIMRGTVVPQDALIVLWTGGYNTWADVETLAQGLILAMGQIPNLHYVSTGGAIAGHDDRTFQRFRAIVDASSFADRFHFVGWVATRDVPRYYLEADFGINCDRRSLEGELGTRNRIIDWVCARLPVVSTDLCELTHLLSQNGLMNRFDFADPAGLAKVLALASQESKDERLARANRAREWLLREFDPAKAYAPLLAWVASPDRAPDLKYGKVVSVKGCPFAVANNALSVRRAEEYVAVGAKRSALGKALRRMKKIFG